MISTSDASVMTLSDVTHSSHTLAAAQQRLIPATCRFRMRQVVASLRCRLNANMMNLSRRYIISAVILCTLLATGAQASESWSDHQTVGRFEIRSEVPVRQSQALSEFVRSLPHHESDIVSSLGLTPNQSPIVINVFQSRRNYLEYMTQHRAAGRDRRALFIQSKSHGSVYVYLHTGVVTDLRHETTHAILHSSFPFLPLWLDEGLAEYFEVSRERRASGHPHRSRVKLDARLLVAWHPSLVSLEAAQDLSDMSAARYRESWTWVHFLLHGPDGAKSVLLRYLSSIEAHIPPGSVSTRLREVWPEPERQLTAHVKSWK